MKLSKFEKNVLLFLVDADLNHMSYTRLDELATQYGINVQDAMDHRDEMFKKVQQLFPKFEHLVLEPSELAESDIADDSDEKLLEMKNRIAVMEETLLKYGSVMKLLVRNGTAEVKSAVYDFMSETGFSFADM